MKEGYSNWRKLDNAALAFPLVTGKNDTRVFRFYCELKENVKPELLQAALEKTMEKYPLFQMVLRKGLFWFYLEHRDIRPIVKEEKKPPCSRLYIPDKKNLLFQVSYYEKRINFEVDLTKTQSEVDKEEKAKEKKNSFLIPVLIVSLLVYSIIIFVIITKRKKNED